MLSIGEVCLETNDVIGLAAFYRKLFNIGEGPEDDNSIHQVLTSGGITLTVYNNGNVKNNSNENISLAFTVDDVDVEYSNLLNMGVRIIDPPTLRLWGAKNMQFQDPDGNHIYFRSFPKNV